MKKYAFSPLIIIILLTTNGAFAQKIIRTQTIRRCGATERVEAIFRFHPELRNLPNQRLPSTNNNYRLQAIVTVPVVVHIVLPNPWLVTDADVQSQIDRLNLDFSGLNPDSTNAGSFLNRRGHSQIQFCLAKRTPGGQLTNGIERIASSTGSNALSLADPIKHTASGGLDVWDPASYLNLWVGVDVSGLGILGYAQFPGTIPVNEDGVFLNYQSFGSSSCYTFSAFNKGRTGTHEVGHYFGLYHIWGDDDGACIGDDFENLIAAGSSVLLPLNLANVPGLGNTLSDIGDTPNQGDASSGCLTGIHPDVCSPANPGIMYQDYMDYTDDACYSMFTKKQVERMEWVVDNARSSLKTSLGCQPPIAAVSLDVLPFQSVNPGGMEATGCTITSYPASLACASSFQPKLRIKNNGAVILTSVTAGYRYDNGPAVSNNFIITIPVGGTAVLTLPSVALTAGNHTLKFFTFNPNGAADQTPANDTLIQSLPVAALASLPQTADFETAAFPPESWSVWNPNGDFTWLRKTPGRNGSAGAMWINNFDVDATNNIDEFRSPNISFTNLNSVVIVFDLAHKNYPATGLHDTLSVLVSSDCGLSWQSVYKKWGATLATAGSSANPYLNPAAADWKTEEILLAESLLTPGQIMVAFRNTNRYGNNIFIDNIKIIPIIRVPTITSFIPASGIIGIAVNINGTNFNSTPADNVVFFGAVKATVNTATSTSLSVSSPASATFQPLTVLNKATALMGSASKPFITTFDNPLIEGISPDFYEFKTNLATGLNPKQVVVADLDGDGKSELITCDYSSDSISIFRNISTSGVLATSSFDMRFRLYSTDPINLVIADVDGDGKQDITAISLTDGIASVYRNIYESGTLNETSFALPVTFPCGNSPVDLSIADLDKDGKPDLAITNFTENIISVLKNNSTAGNISFLAKQNFTTGSNPNSIAISDLDVDGKPDIVVTNYGSNALSVLKNQSPVNAINANSFAAKVDFTTGFGASSAKAADLDNDGRPEIIIVDSAANTISVFRNTGNGTINPNSFAPRFDFATGANPVSLAISDLDGDGKPDLAYSNKGSNSFSVLRRKNTPAPI
ncbi:MAG TPA: FG-GAP-like repeat-containing protein, partial [Chitinophagaceae bacterium]|nr:FG-GAP-like repeat-containing protein [Chitinophagaceae bacterium]